MAVTAFRGKTKRLDGPYLEGPIAAAEKLYRLAIIMRDASGNLKNGATAAGCFGVGVARYNDTAGDDPNVWDNSSGLAGALRGKYDKGIFGPFVNSGNSITVGMEGRPCFIVDNETVHATSNGGARSPGGVIYRVDPDGVYVYFDELLVRAALVTGSPAGITFNQTAYATADPTIANLTSSELTDSTGGSANTTLASVNLPGAVTDNGGGAAANGTIEVVTLPTAVTDSTGGTPGATLDAINGGGATCENATKNAIASLAARQAENRTAIDALRDAVKELSTKANLANTAIDVLRDNDADLAAQHNALRADLIDVKQAVNSSIDVMQAAGLAG